MERTLAQWNQVFREKMSGELHGPPDPAHDLAHFERVVKTALELARQENANESIVLPAAWFHDLVNVPKNDPRRSQASRLSAEAADQVLDELGYDSSHRTEIKHAIEAHSYSADITPTTLEAKIVQDADRLDGLGAIGIARVFSVGGMLGRKIYSPTDPLGERGRTLNDLEYTVDHFFVKLFKTVEKLNTSAGRAEGLRRVELMKSYLSELKRECEI